MNINIDSQDLLDILLEAGIQTVDAKALILDILTLQENRENPPKKQEETPTPPVKYTQPQPRLRPIETRTSTETKVYGDAVESDTSGDSDDSTITPFEEEEKRPSVTRVQGKSVGTRPKFDGFGGDSTGALRR